MPLPFRSGSPLAGERFASGLTSRGGASRYTAVSGASPSRGTPPSAPLAPPPAGTPRGCGQALAASPASARGTPGSPGRGRGDPRSAHAPRRRGFPLGSRSRARRARGRSSSLPVWRSLLSLLAQVLLERRPHLGAGAVKEHPLVGLAQAERVARLARAEPAEVPQGDHLPLAGRKAADRVEHHRAGAVAREALVGLLPAGVRRSRSPRVRARFSRMPTIQLRSEDRPSNRSSPVSTASHVSCTTSSATARLGTWARAIRMSSGPSPSTRRANAASSPARSASRRRCSSRASTPGFSQRTPDRGLPGRAKADLSHESESYRLRSLTSGRERLDSGHALALSPVECQTANDFPAESEVPSDFGGTRMKLKPLGDRLIVKAIEEEETTASGIVLPDTAK